jgi:dihydrofolate reductase
MAKTREEQSMTRVIVGMTMSLDGFVADQSGSADLYPDLASLRGTGYMDAMIEGTGAVLMGKRTFEMAADPDWYVGNYEYQVPIFVLTHEPPQVVPKQDEHLTFTFVTDGIESAIAQATAAAGDKAVQGGWRRQCGRAASARRAGRRAAGRDVMLVLLGTGLPFFGNSDLARVQLEKTGVQEVGARTSLNFRVKK